MTKITKATKVTKAAAKSNAAAAAAAVTTAVTAAEAAKAVAVDVAAQLYGGRGEASFGRTGSASALYKFIIAVLKLDNSEAWSAVASVLGVDAAGEAHYPGWYRAAMKRARG